MFIQTEKTPNPAAIKFLPGIDISPNGPVFYDSIEEAADKNSPESSDLAVKMFQISGVEAVFYGYNFITITKKEEYDWNLLKPEILMVLMDHITAGFTVFDTVSDSVKNHLYDDKELSDIEKEIIEIIETRVRPSVAMDGGDITYRGFKDGIVFLQLKGACSGCPSSSVTLKNGIESMLQHFVPEVKSVEAINE